MKEKIDLTGKCGSCYYFHQIEGTAKGECHKLPYFDDVAHDPKHPYVQQTRSRPHCKKYRKNPITNADRIRAMSDEELAKKISGIEQFALTTNSAWSRERWLDWLKQEAT